MDCMWAKPFRENSDGSWDGGDWTDGMPDNMAETLKSSYLAYLDTELQRLDPMLGELDSGDGVMPARFDKDGDPVERYESLTGRLTVDGNRMPVVEYAGETYRSPHRLALAWSGTLTGAPRPGYDDLRRMLDSTRLFDRIEDTDGLMAESRVMRLLLRLVPADGRLAVAATGYEATDENGWERVLTEAFTGRDMGAVCMWLGRLSNELDRRARRDRTLRAVIRGARLKTREPCEALPDGRPAGAWTRHPGRTTNQQPGGDGMSGKAMPLGKKFKVRLTVTPEETGTPVDMLGFTFTSGTSGHVELNAEYGNLPKLADDGLDSLSILVILKVLETWAQKGYELYAPIARQFHGGGR